MEKQDKSTNFLTAYHQVGHKVDEVDGAGTCHKQLMDLLTAKQS